MSSGTLLTRRAAPLAGFALSVLAGGAGAQRNDPDEAYSSPDQAARRALTAAATAAREFQGRTGRNVEYGGWIYRTESGGYGYTAPHTSRNLATVRGLRDMLEQQNRDANDDSFVPRLAGTGEEVVGTYHTHPYSPEHDVEHFSVPDLEFAERYNVPSYLFTAGERYLKYDPDRGDPGSEPSGGNTRMEPFRSEEPRPAHAEGEPHLGTHDGELFDFHAAGEFVALETDDGLRAMLRFEPYLDLESVSVVTGVAVALGTDRVGVYTQAPYLLVNGRAPTSDAANVDGVRLPSGLVVTKKAGTVTIATELGDVISVRNRFDTYLDAELAIPEARRGAVRGLLGDFDSNPDNDFRTRDGTVVDVFSGSNGENRRRLYSVWGQSWRANEAESIFDYVHGKTAREYQIADFPRTIRRYDTLERDESFAAAKQTCRGSGIAEQSRFERCVFDVVVAGDSRFTLSYVDEATARYGAAFAADAGVVVEGRIGAPGMIDRHAIDVREAGQLLFVQQERFAGSLDLVNVGLFRDDGQAIVNKCFGCGAIGLLAVETPGVYYLQAGSERDQAVGDYALRYWYVPAPSQYEIEADASIGLGRPAAGAGAIERPGAADEYRFSVAGSTTLRITVEQFDPPLDLVTWQLLGADGGRVVQKCLGCGAEETVSLAEGQYVLRVGTVDREAGVGRYSLSLSRGR